MYLPTQIRIGIQQGAGPQAVQPVPAQGQCSGAQQPQIPLAQRGGGGGGSNKAQRMQQIVQQNPQMLAAMVAQLAQQNAQVMLGGIIKPLAVSNWHIPSDSV